MRRARDERLQQPSALLQIPSYSAHFPASQAAPVHGHRVNDLDHTMYRAFVFVRESHPPPPPPHHNAAWLLPHPHVSHDLPCSVDGHRNPLVVTERIDDCSG